MKPSETAKQKIVSCDRFIELTKASKDAGASVAFTNGCFDILHKGHIHYLSEASAYGDLFVIGLNSDASVRRLKGSDRPLQDEGSRALVLASLFFVDFVIIFEEDTPYELLSKVSPDVLIKGGDYRAEEVVGYDLVTEAGGCVFIIPYLEGYSTSSIVSKIKRSQ